MWTPLGKYKFPSSSNYGPSSYWFICTSPRLKKEQAFVSSYLLLICWGSISSCMPGVSFSVGKNCAIFWMPVSVHLFPQDVDIRQLRLASEVNGKTYSSWWWILPALHPFLLWRQGGVLGVRKAMRSSVKSGRFLLEPLTATRKVSCYCVYFKRPIIILSLLIIFIRPEGHSCLQGVCQEQQLSLDERFLLCFTCQWFTSDSSLTTSPVITWSFCWRKSTQLESWLPTPEYKLSWHYDAWGHM